MPESVFERAEVKSERSCLREEEKERVRVCERGRKGRVRDCSM